MQFREMNDVIHAASLGEWVIQYDEVSQELSRGHAVGIFSYMSKSLAEGADATSIYFAVTDDETPDTAIAIAELTYKKTPRERQLRMLCLYVEPRLKTSEHNFRRLAEVASFAVVETFGLTYGTSYRSNAVKVYCGEKPIDTDYMRSLAASIATVLPIDIEVHGNWVLFSRK